MKEIKPETTLEEQFELAKYKQSLESMSQDQMKEFILILLSLVMQQKSYIRELAKQVLGL